MAPFGRREPPHVGSGIDKPESGSLVAKWHTWVAALLRPIQREKTGNGTEQPVAARGRRHIRRRV